MTEEKERTYSQRGDDYLIEAQKVCAEDKPKPPVVCPYCGSTAPKTVYVCSPFRPTAVSEADREAERAAGMQFGLSWLEQADELWVFGDTVSEGMAQEIARAKELGKPVYILPEPGRVEELRRCWLRKPTYKEMEAVPWGDD